MPEERPLWIRSGSIRLEGALSLSSREGPAPAALLCHPHPLYGGDMDNNVVQGLRGGLEKAGFSVLRFNFRGVGRSEGGYGDGAGERADVQAAIDALASEPGVMTEGLLVAGYSFGAWVGMAVAAADPRVGSLVAVAPPLALWPMDDLSECPRPKLAIAGSRDEHCPAALFHEWFEGLPGPKERAVLEGTDHFFRGREAEVGTLAAEFALRHSSGGGLPER